MRRAKVGSVAASALIVGALLTGCSEGSSRTAVSPSSSARVRLSADQLEALSAKLANEVTCEERFDLAADPNFFDPARGFDCIRKDRSAVFVRVYSDAATVPRALQHWEPTLGAWRQWMHGDNWIAMGPKDALEGFRGVEGASAPSKTPPSSVETTRADADRDTCMSLVTSTAADLVERPDDFAASRRALDEQFPGSSATIRRKVTPELAATLRGKPDFEVAAELSRFGDDFRDVCREALAADRDEVRPEG